MKKQLLLVFLLATAVSTSFPATTDMTEKIIFGGTIASSIFVREYDVPPMGKWKFSRELVIPAKGSVGTIGITPLNSKEEFSLYYTYQSQNQQIQARNIRIDYDNFNILKDTSVPAQYGTYSVGVNIITKISMNRARFGFVTTGYDVSTEKIRDTTGKPFTKKTPIFDGNPDFIPLSTSISWDGTHAAQALLQRSTGSFFGDLQNLSNTGKPSGNPVRYQFSREVFNVSAGITYDRPGGSSFYNVATQERNIKGSIDQTGVFLHQLDAATNQPIGSPVTVSSFKNISASNFNAAFFNTAYIYDQPDKSDLTKSRSWFIWGEESKQCHKLVTFAREFNPFTLKRGFKQTLVGCNDPILKNNTYFYALYGMMVDYGH